MQEEADSSLERKYDAQSRVSRIRDARRVLQHLQEEMVREQGEPIPCVDAAIQNLENAVVEIERKCAGEPPGYDARPSTAEVAQLLGGQITRDAVAPAARSPEPIEQARPAYVAQSVRALRDTWRAIDLSVLADAPYLHRLQLHVADAAHHCHDLGTLRKALGLLRGTGAAESDTTDGIASAVAMSEDVCAAIDAVEGNAPGQEDDVTLDPELIHYVRRAVSPFVEQLPSDDEITNFVANERTASKRGRPRKGSQGSKKPDRLEDVASLLGLNAENHDSIRRRVDKHRRAVTNRVRARKLPK